MQVLTKNNSSVALGRLKGDLDIWKSDLRKRQQCLYSDCDKIKKIAFDVMKTMEDKEFLSKTILDLKVGVKNMYDSVEPLKEIIDSVSKDSLDYDFKISTASRAIKDLYLSMLTYKEKTNKHHFDDNDEDPLTAIVELCPKIHELFESGKARWDDEKKKMQGELHQYKEELHKHVLASNAASFDFQKMEEILKQLQSKSLQLEEAQSTVKLFQDQIKTQTEIIAQYQSKELGRAAEYQSLASSPKPSRSVMENGEQLYESEMDEQLAKTDKVIEGLIQEAFKKSNAPDRDSDILVIVKTMEDLFEQLQKNSSASPRDINNLSNEIKTLHSALMMEKEPKSLKDDKESSNFDYINNNGMKLASFDRIGSGGLGCLDQLKEIWREERNFLLKEIKKLKAEVFETQKRASEKLREREMVHIEQEKSLKTSICVAKDEWERKSQELLQDKATLELSLRNIKDCTQELEGLKTMVEAYEMENTSLKISIQERESDVKSAMRKLKDTEIQYAIILEERNKAQALKNDYECLQRKYDTIKFHFDNSLKSLEDSNMEVTRMIEDKRFQSKFLPPAEPVVVVNNNNVEQEKLIKSMEKKTHKQEKEIRNLRKDIEGFKGQTKEKGLASDLERKSTLINSLQKDLDRISLELHECIMHIKEKESIIGQMKAEMRMMNERNFILGQENHRLSLFLGATTAKGDTRMATRGREGEVTMGGVTA